MRWGHHVSACRSVYPFCAVCAGPHETHSHEAFVAKGFVNSALKTPRCVNCIAAKKHADHEATSSDCLFFRARHNRRAITDLLNVIRENKYHGFKSPFNSRDFNLVHGEVSESQLQTLHGSIFVAPDGTASTAPAAKGKKSKTVRGRRT